MMEVLRKTILVARPIGTFVNGPQKGDLSVDRISEIVDNFTRFPRQVPIFLALETGDHPKNMDGQLPVGWVEGLSQDRDGNMMASVKLIGPGAEFVAGDLIRSASIGTVGGKNPDGSSQGEVLQHLLLTNDPFIRDMNIAASRSLGGERAAIYFTAYKETPMGGTKKLRLQEEGEGDAFAKCVAGKLAEGMSQEDAEAACQLVVQDEDEKKEEEMKAKNEEIVTLKAKNMQLEETVEELKDSIKNRPADLGKEQMSIRLKRLELKTECQEVRELVFQGLQTGTLKPSWCKDYNQGKGATKDDSTMSWFKASRFQGDKKLLEWAVNNNPPMYRVGQSFASGDPAPVSRLNLTQEEKASLPESVDPSLLEQIDDSTTFADYRRIKKELGGKN